MKKLQAMQKGVEESKKRLDNISVEGEAYEGKIKITLTGNRKMKDISIHESLLKDKEDLEDMLVVAFNRALEKADGVNEAEMQGAAKGMMPGLGF